VFYIGVPDMAIGPLYYSVYDAACVTVAAERPDRRRRADLADDGAAPVHRRPAPFDYCNTANYWMRTSDNPYQPACST
jgi:hypothetical protein